MSVQKPDQTICPAKHFVGGDHRKKEELKQSRCGGVGERDRLQVSELGAGNPENGEREEGRGEGGAPSAAENHEENHGGRKHPDADETDDRERKCLEQRLRGGPAEAPEARPEHRQYEGKMGCAHGPPKPSVGNEPRRPPGGSKTVGGRRPGVLRT